MNKTIVIMDYEKKYKEALERAKEELGSNSFERGSIEYIFPELQESEENRIKREIVNYIHEGAAIKGEKIPTEWIDWLEKQSEQKPQRMISAEAKEALYDKPADSYCEENCKGYNERQGQVKKSSETQHENKTCKENADSLTQDNDERKPSDKDWVEALRTEYEKGRADAIAEMQKPADGTFVDIDDVREDFMAEVYRVLDADPTNDRANQIIDAFDSLPITSIQKPAEWSEKDESHRIGIMQTISGAIKLNVISKKTGDMQIGWLKSLKPQNRWKPSEEQMNALNAMILNYSLSQNATLVELYNDLKKLKD